MAYKAEIKEFAFARYCIATSYEQVAEMMRAEFPEECANLSRGTVIRWAKDYKWDERKAQIEREVAAKNDKAIVSDRKHMLGQMRTLRDTIFEKVKIAEVRSMEGGSAAYVNMAKWIITLSGEGKNRIDVDDAIMLIFEILSKHPTIGPLIRQHETFLLAELHTEISRRAAEDGQ